MPNIINEIKLDYKDVLLCPRRSDLKSRADVELLTEITFLHSKRTYKSVPIVASNMDNVGTFEMAKALAKHRLTTEIQKYYTVEDWKNFATESPESLQYVCVSSGTKDHDLTRLDAILKAVPEIPFIVLYNANGYSKYYVESVKQIRSLYPNHTLLAGDVATPDMVQELILAGADAVHVGIGPGSVCTTRTKTGVGYPQLSAVMECAAAAHSLGGHILADGGVTCVGDIAKALGAGGDFVMLGQMFAGHEQGGGEIVEKNGKRYCQFYGMCSSQAMNKHYGGVAGYRSVEGKSVEVPYKGDVEDTILDMLGGLRSACTYVGAARLQELPERATFVRCTQQINNIFGPPPMR